MNKSDILKGLRSKNIKEKTKTMRQLLINIINDPYYDQMLMTGKILFFWNTTQPKLKKSHFLFKS